MRLNLHLAPDSPAGGGGTDDLAGASGGTGTPSVTVTDQELIDAMAGAAAAPDPEESGTGADDAGQDQDETPAETTEPETQDVTPADGDERPNPEWSPGVQKRVAKLAKQRDTLQTDLTKSQAEIEQLRREREDLTLKQAQLAHVQHLVDLANQNPDRTRTAEEILRLAGALPAGTPAPKTPQEAQMLLLTQQVADLNGRLAQRDSYDRETIQVRHDETAINTALAAEKITKQEDMQYLGDLIHAKVIANRARGATVPIATIAKAVIQADAQRRSATVTQYKTAVLKPKGASAPSGRARVPMSASAKENHDRLAIRKGTGAVDPNWWVKAAEEFGEQLETANRTAEGW